MKLSYGGHGGDQYNSFKQGMGSLLVESSP